MASALRTEKNAGEPDRIEISGAEARQGEIILRSRRRRIVFIAGLLGIVLLAAILRILAA